MSKSEEEIQKIRESLNEQAEKLRENLNEYVEKIKLISSAKNLSILLGDTLSPILSSDLRLAIWAAALRAVNENKRRKCCEKKMQIIPLA